MPLLEIRAPHLPSQALTHPPDLTIGPFPTHPTPPHPTNERTNGSPIWNFDGSSTGQAPGDDSEVLLKPQAIYPDPFRGGKNILVMCDCYKPDMTPIKNNTRKKCAELMEKVTAQVPWFGIEQEYTLFEADGVTPFGWPKGTSRCMPRACMHACLCVRRLSVPCCQCLTGCYLLLLSVHAVCCRLTDRPPDQPPDQQPIPPPPGGFPGAQGPYYCSVGTENAFGRHIAEAHYKACLYAGINISGINGVRLLALAPVSMLAYTHKPTPTPHQPRLCSSASPLTSQTPNSPPPPPYPPPSPP